MRVAKPIGVAIIFAALSAASFAVYQSRVKTLGKQPDNSYLIPTNQSLTPLGRIELTQGSRPKDIAVSLDGKQFAALCTNRVWIYKANGEPVADVSITASALGICWAPNGSTIWISESGGRLRDINLTDGKWTVGEILNVDVPGPAATRAGGNKISQPLGMAISPDGQKLYVALGIRNAVAVVSTVERKVITAIPVGVAPYNVTLSADGKELVVANLGGELADNQGLGTQDSAGTLVKVDPHTDASALGSLTVIDTKALTTKTIAVGRQPRGMAITRDGRTCFVTNSSDDTVSVVDLRGGKVTSTFSVRPAQDLGYGQIPVACALSGDEERLYVACGGANSIAVVTVKGASKVEGYIPTGWYPLGVAQVEGSLAVACSKGIGARPDKHDRGYGVHASTGMVQSIPLDELKSLAKHTRQVAQNNQWGEPAEARIGMRPVPVPQRVGEPSVFKYVVYIIKENHTYDLDLGDMKEGNGDPKLCLFPEEVTPNAHALAREFILLDNTYTSGTNSADGHQWVASSVGNSYIEQNYGAHDRSYPYDGGDPLAYSPAGFLWNQAVSGGKTVRVYGEFVNRPKVTDPATGRTPTWKQLWDDFKAGGSKYRITADTDLAALKPYIHPNFIGFPSIVSDQWRADQYLAELKQFEAEGKMPNLSIMLLPNDHTSGTRAGMPTPRSATADNDLALGRIVDAISKSKFWKETLILVVQDDSQLAFDHVDGHRMPVQVISPYTRRKAVNHEPYNHTSFARTIGLVLGLAPMNRFDRTGQPLTACFTTKPDFAPYTFRPAKIKLDDLNPRATNLQGDAKRWALASQRQDMSDIDRVNPEVFGRAVWHSVRPTAPFPTAQFNPPAEDSDEDD